MAIVDVTNVVASNDGFLTRSNTVNALVTMDTYNFEIEQDFLSVTNNGDKDITFNIGDYGDVTLHTKRTWSNKVDFKSFTIIANKETTSFTFMTKEYDNTPVTISKFWELCGLRDKAVDGDIILITADAGSSAAAVNSAIAGVDEEFVRTVSVELQNAATVRQTWFNGNFPITLSKTGSGIATTDNFITLIDGIGTIDITYTGSWVATNTTTLTIIGGSQLGYTVANKTSVDTLIA